jgi:hypothetical protein
MARSKKHEAIKESLADVVRRLGESPLENGKQRNVALAESIWASALGSPPLPDHGLPAKPPEMWAQRALFDFLAGKPAQADTPASQGTKLKALEQVKDAARLNALARARDSDGIAQSPSEGGAIRSAPANSDGQRTGSDSSVDVREMPSDELGERTGSISGS